MFPKASVKVIIILFILIILTGSMFIVQTALGTNPQGSAKSTGLSQIGTIENFEQVERLLREHARAIDVIHRQLLGDIDTINRDTIPGVIEDIAQAVDFDVPLMKDIAFTAPGGVPTWSTGIVSFGGTDYTIVAGAAPNNTHVAVYWPGADTTHFGTTDSPTAVAGRWYMAFKPAGAGTTIYQALQSTIVHGGLLQASTVTANAFVANAAATNINDVGSSTKILPGKVRVSSGTSTTLDSWGTDNAGVTYIDGGDIYTGSVTTNQLNFTPVKSTDVIARINASTEPDGAGTLNITGEKISISGSTTFTGTDSLTGGKFDTASSGARVRIFPSANIGFQAIDSAGSTVFEVDVGGTNQGDVTIGNYTGNKGCKWDDSAGTFDVRGTLHADDISTGTLTVGNSSINVGTGAISFGSNSLLKVETDGTIHIGSQAGSGGAYSVELVQTGGGLGKARKTLYPTSTPEQYASFGLDQPNSGVDFDGFVIEDAGTNQRIYGVLGYASSLKANHGLNVQTFGLGGAEVHAETNVTGDAYTNYFDPLMYTVAGDTYGGKNGVDIRLGFHSTKYGLLDWSAGGALSIAASCIDSGTIDNTRINPQIKVGTYSGTGTNPRDVTTVGFQPDAVLVWDFSTDDSYLWSTDAGSTSLRMNTTAHSTTAITGSVANGFTVNSTCNVSSRTYYFIALRD